MEGSGEAIGLVSDPEVGGVRLSRLLTLCRFTVEPAFGYDAALAWLASSHDPRILLVDLREGLDGYKAFRQRLRDEALTDRVHVLALADLDTLGERELFGIGLASIVPHDAPPEELLFRINELLFAGDELRTHPRVFTELPARLQSDAGEITGVVINLSEGGAFVRTEQSLPAGTEVRITFSLPEMDAGAGSDLGGRARVRFHVDRMPLGGGVTLSGLGLEFLRLDGLGEVRVAGFILREQRELAQLLGET